MTSRLLIGLSAVAGYALLSHWLMVHAPDAPWAVAALFGPLLLPCLVLAWRRGSGPVFGLALAALAGLVLIVAAGGLGDVRRLYLMQHAGVHLAIGLGFAASLRGPGLSVISQVAQRVHGSLTPAMHAYTIRVTRLWVAYFFGMALASVAVFALLPWAAWSLLANLLTPVAIALVFVIEHLVRYRLHPEFERVSLAATVRAFQRRGA